MVEEKTIFDLCTQLEELITAHEWCENNQFDLLSKLGEGLIAKMEEADSQLAELSASIVTEHEEGFNKVLRQTTFILGVDTTAKGFNIMKDIYKEYLVSLEEMSNNLE